MQRVFDLPRLPQRIEIYDNSHIQGSYAIGAMVVATPEGFDKKSYRTFNIKNSEITNDDFAMMKEVLTVVSTGWHRRTVLTLFCWTAVWGNCCGARSFKRF